MLPDPEERKRKRQEAAAKRKAAEADLALLEKETRRKYAELYTQKFGDN